MAAANGSGEADVGTSPLARALGLSSEEVSAVGDALTAQLTSMGLDGAAVFSRLRDGEPIGAALGFPKHTTDILYARAYQWIQVGRPDKAEPLFRALCVLDGREADYWIGYGICLRERRADPDAALAFATALRLRPRWAVAHFHAFTLAATTGDWPRADAHWKLFLETEDGTTPEAVRQEARRMRTAIDVFRSARRSP